MVASDTRIAHDMPMLGDVACVTQTTKPLLLIKMQPQRSKSALTGAANSVIDAAALQDHLVRTVLCNERPRLGPPHIRKAPPPLENE